MIKSFWQTQNALTRLNLAFWRLIAGVKSDLHNLIVGFVSDLLRSTSFHKDIKNIAVKLGIVKIPQVSSLETSFIHVEDKPVIFVSYCASADYQGDLKFCGGTKELNYLVKLLRERGYEAYIVTYAGTYEPWLLDHQPHISLPQFKEIISKKSNVRCVTSLAIATAFINASPSLFFWDMELALTENHHFSLLSKLYRSKIKTTAAISRTIQAWHMANFQRSCVLIPNLLDTSLWSSKPFNRKKYRIGYMNEGLHTQEYIRVISDFTKSNGLDIEYHQISGVESEILIEMNRCEVFLSMNIGKDALWGEGCPRTVIESLAAGCVVIAFDIIGVRETIQHNFNGILVSRYRPDLMAKELVRLYNCNNEVERLRKNSQSLIESCHTFDARWSAVQEFLIL